MRMPVEPAPREDAVTFRLGPSVPADAAPDVRPAAGDKRVKNARMLQELGVTLAYPRRERLGYTKRGNDGLGVPAVFPSFRPERSGEQKPMLGFADGWDRIRRQYVWPWIPAFT